MLQWLTELGSYQALITQLVITLVLAALLGFLLTVVVGTAAAVYSYYKTKQWPKWWHWPKKFSISPGLMEEDSTGRGSASRLSLIIVVCTLCLCLIAAVYLNAYGPTNGPNREWAKIINSLTIGISAVGLNYGVKVASSNFGKTGVATTTVVSTSTPIPGTVGMGNPNSDLPPVSNTATTTSSVPIKPVRQPADDCGES